MQLHFQNKLKLLISDFQIQILNYSNFFLLCEIGHLILFIYLFILINFFFFFFRLPTILNEITMATSDDIDLMNVDPFGGAFGVDEESVLFNYLFFNNERKGNLTEKGKL